FAGEELEDAAGAHGLADALCAGLALFAREQRAEFFLAGDDLVADLVERVVARLDAAPGPAREGRPPRGHGALALRGVGVAVLADQVAEVRRIDVLRVGIAGDPLAVDQVLELVRHRILQLIDARLSAPSEAPADRGGAQRRAARHEPP